MNQIIQSLRGIFIFLIFLSHFIIDEKPILEPGGDIGVAFFFILSGYCLCLSYDSSSENKIKFYTNRLAKIFPLHILCWLIAIGIYNSLNLKIDFFNFFLLQSWIARPEFYFSLNAVSWYLSTLMFCYFIFPFIYKYYADNQKKFIILTLCFLFIIIFIYLPFINFLSPESDIINYWSYIFPPVRTADFIIGVFLYMITRSNHSIWVNFKLFLTNYCDYILPFIVIILMILCNWCYRIPQVYVSASLWWCPLSLLVLLSFIVPPNKSFVLRILQWKYLVFWGNISFSFFMLHLLVLNSLDKIVWIQNPTFRFIVAFIIITLLSYIAEFKIIKPITHVTKNYIRKVFA